MSLLKLSLVNCLISLCFVLAEKIIWDKVKLEVYIESGCPVSQAFILGELSTVLAMPDISSITEFKYVPFGNSFFNKSLRSFQCYDEIECQTDAIQICSLYKFSNDISAVNSGVNSYACFPFISCIEANSGLSSSAESCWKNTMTNITTLSWSTIYDCSVTEFNKVMTLGDEATPLSLTTVPWVLVDSKLLSDPESTLLSSICAAYKGPQPASCK